MEATYMGAYIDCYFRGYCSMRIQDRLTIWQVENWRSLLLISLSRMDGEAIIYFAYEILFYFISYLSFFVQLIS